MIKMEVTGFEIPELINKIFQGLSFVGGYTAYNEPEAEKLFENIFKDKFDVYSLRYVVTDGDLFDYACALNEEILKALGDSVLERNGLKGPEEGS